MDKILLSSKQFKKEIIVQCYCDKDCTNIVFVDTGKEHEGSGRYWLTILTDDCKATKKLDPFLRICGLDTIELESLVQALDYAYNQGVSICSGFGEYTLLIQRDSELITEGTDYYISVFKLKDLNSKHPKRIHEMRLDKEQFEQLKDTLKAWLNEEE